MKEIEISMFRNGAHAMERVQATTYGEFWAVTRDGQPSLTHIPTGLALTPPSFRTKWTATNMRRAAKLLATKPEIWNFGPDVANDGKNPRLQAAYEHWKEVLTALFPDQYGGQS